MVAVVKAGGVLNGWDDNSWQVGQANQFSPWPKGDEAVQLKKERNWQVLSRRCEIPTAMSTTPMS